MKTQNTCFSSLFHFNFFSYTSWYASVEKIKKFSSWGHFDMLRGFFFFCYVYWLHWSKKLQVSVQCEQTHNSHHMKLFRSFGVFSLFLKYCSLKFINSQNLKMLKYWLTQLLITGCSYRELEEPPMGFLLQQYCTYYMNKLHCCIMQLLHHQFRE